MQVRCIFQRLWRNRCTWKGVECTSSDDKLTQINIVGGKDWEKVYSLLLTSFLPKLCKYKQPVLRRITWRLFPKKAGTLSDYRVEPVVIGFHLCQQHRGGGRRVMISKNLWSLNRPLFLSTTPVPKYVLINTWVGYRILLLVNLCFPVGKYRISKNRIIYEETKRYRDPEFSFNIC